MISKRSFLAAAAMIASLSSLSGPLDASQWQPIEVSCPEGRQISPFKRDDYFRLKFPQTIDLFSGLFRDMKAVRECRESGFPSYRRFTDEELQRINVLMKTDSYQRRQKTGTRAGLALWVEEQLNQTVEPSLAYRLNLSHTNEVNSENQKQRYGALFAVVRDRHSNTAKNPFKLARLQIQLAYLSHKAENGEEIDWLKRAVATFEAIPSAERHRNQYEALNRNIGAVRLCLLAPDDLAEKLCGKSYSTVRRVLYQGIEGLAYSAHDAMSIHGLQFVNANLQSIVHERLRDPNFKQLFDELFISIMRKSGHSTNDCDLLLLTSDGPNCEENARSAYWTKLQWYFPSIVSSMREQQRLKVLRFAADKFYSGEENHRAVQWANEQPDFEAIKTPARKQNLTKLATLAGKHSVLCSLDRPCNEPSSFEAAMRYLRNGDPDKYRKIFEEAELEQVKKEIDRLAWCDVSVELGELSEGMCFTSKANPLDVIGLRSLTGQYDQIYAERRAKMLESVVTKNGER